MRKKIVTYCIAGMLAFAGVISISGCGAQETDIDTAGEGGRVLEENLNEEHDAEQRDKKEDIEEQSKRETENPEKEEPGNEDQEAENAQTGEFAITTRTYEEGDIHIEYPQVENLVNEEITEWYNKKFAETVEAFTGEVEEGDLAAVSETVNETFTVTYQSKDMVSILIEGTLYSEGAAHPYSYKSSYNIDLNTGETLGMMDIYEAEELAEDLLNSRNCTPMENAETLESMSGEMLEYIQQEMSMYGRELLYESLKHCDYDFHKDADGGMKEGEEPVYLYSIRLSDGAWGIILDVSHALGDYAVIRYDK